MTKKWRKRFVSLIVLTCVLMGIFNFNIAFASNEFSDVINYYPYNSWAIETGEKYDLIFLEKITRECKRYEIVSILYHMLDLKNSSKNVFNDLDDVPSDIKNKVNSVYNEGIISGYEDGSFKPYNNVSRAEFVTMLNRSGILENISEKTKLDFKDVQNHWAKKNIDKVTSIGLLAGKGDGLFCPEDNITPQEILVIMDRLVNMNCISSEKLVDTITNTFKCKQYTEKEKYIVEVMYNKFDTVQNFMKYAFPYKQYYTYDDLEGVASYEDIRYIIYFMMSYYSNIQDSGETAEKYNEIGQVILNEKASSGKEYTIRDFLYAVCKIDRLAYMYGYSDTMPMPNVKYSNKSQFSDKENAMLKKIFGNQYNTLLVNNEMYLPLDAPLTKYILNYFTMQLEKTFDSYEKSRNFAFTNYQGYATSYETNRAKLPYNYYEYPYIIKDVPKEIYEIPYRSSDVLIPRTPIGCYEKYSEIFGRAGSHVNRFFDTILNVDYRTIDEAEFKKALKDNVYYAADDEISEYIQYVKENKIILEGTGVAIPGTGFMIDNGLRLRTIVKFKVISANKMENLLFGDVSPLVGKDVIYNQKEFEIYPDILINRIDILDREGNRTGKTYKPEAHPIVYILHYNSNQMP